MSETVKSLATFLLIFNGLGTALVIPLAGAAGAAGLLTLLTLRALFWSKSETAIAGAGGQNLIKTAAAAPGLNIWNLIIRYFTAPLNQFEKIMLALGWAFLPIAAAAPFVLIFGLAKYAVCNAPIVFDWCKLLGV